MNKQIVIILGVLVSISLACVQSAAVSSYLPAEGRTSPTAPASEVGETCYRVVSDGALHVRARGSAVARVIGYLAPGDIVSGESALNGWMLIRSGALTGWVNAVHLEESECK